MIYCDFLAEFTTLKGAYFNAQALPTLIAIYVCRYG